MIKDLVNYRFNFSSVIFSMFVLYLTLLGLVSVSFATPVGPKSAGVALAGLAIASKLAEDECDDVGVSCLSEMYNS